MTPDAIHPCPVPTTRKRREGDMWACPRCGKVHVCRWNVADDMEWQPTTLQLEASR